MRGGVIAVGIAAFALLKLRSGRGGEKQTPGMPSGGGTPVVVVPPGENETASESGTSETPESKSASTPSTTSEPEPEPEPDREDESTSASESGSSGPSSSSSSGSSSGSSRPSQYTTPGGGVDEVGGYVKSGGKRYYY